MPVHVPVGPYETVDLGDGSRVPFYVIPFDRKGRCLTPRTRVYLLDGASGGNYTDVFVFSHGWNNDWDEATARYRHFLEGYMDMRRQHGFTYDRPFQPLLVGIFWPATSLVLPWERAPDMAATSTEGGAAGEMQALQALAGELADEETEQLYALWQRSEGLDRDEALALARLLQPIYNTPDTDLRDEAPAAAPGEIIDVWYRTSSSERLSDEGDFGFLGGGATTSGSRAPNAAGLMDFLDPRKIIRLTTVLLMKDRAGRVGAHGVGPLLGDLLDTADEARLHLIGHSYGSKVMLSAVAHAELPRSVSSMLLLQPAVSYLCFAEDVGGGQAGGYRIVLDRVEQPILTTYSPHDAPLRRFFHLAVRRRSDLGEARIAGAPPSRFAALGGYGPGGCDVDVQQLPIKRLGDTYALDGGEEILALDGRGIIMGHGDISNVATWWALYNQVNGVA